MNIKDNKELKRLSKFISLLLRHKPETIGLSLDENGWADISQLIQLSAAKGRKISRASLDLVVQHCEKQRFSVSQCGRYIRANQGHSISVDVELEQRVPPSILYHGTAIRFVAAIREEGLTKGKRQYVHLTESLEVAKSVGTRHGKPQILVVDAAAMHKRGIPFYLSKNNVWLTETVPVEFLQAK